MHSGHASAPSIDKPTARQRLHASAGVSSKSINEHGAGTRVGGSCLDDLHQQGSARIRFPNTDGDALDAVLLNTAGGLTGDDHIQWHARAGKNSRLSISTAACEKIYRTHGPVARQHTRLDIEQAARLDWLPQETIVFDGAALQRSLHVHVALDAQVLLVESLVFGRQAMNEAYDSIKVLDRWRIYRGGTLLHAEDFRLDTREVDALQQGVLHHYRATTTLVFISHESAEYLNQQAQRIRDLANEHAMHVNAAATVMKNRLVLRVLACNSFELRKFLIPCIECLSDGAPVPPVWNV